MYGGESSLAHCLTGNHTEQGPPGRGELPVQGTSLPSTHRTAIFPSVYTFVLKWTLHRSMLTAIITMQGGGAVMR